MQNLNWMKCNAAAMDCIGLVCFGLVWNGLQEILWKNLNLTQLKDRLDSRSAQNLKTMSCELNIERLGEICQGW